MDRVEAERVLLEFLAESEIEFETPEPHTYVLALPGTRKLSTTTSVIVGEQVLTVIAFVARNPDENREAVYRWLMRRNARMLAVGFAIDELGDIYLVSRLPLGAVTANGIDLIIGAVLENADESFNTILEMGFASAIRREWEWRISRGESTANLAAFAHLADPKATDG
jgi:hypothetical protein